VQHAQYTSLAFGQRCREMGVRPSMGSVGDAYDNAMAESFFATLECELIARSRFATQAEARLAVFDFIEGFYNPRRRHSALGYLSPDDFERQHDNSTASPDVSQAAAVLVAVKDKPYGRAKRRVLDAHCARRPMQRAGRDEGTGARQAEQRNTTREDEMTSNQLT
jgi:Integrase core domain